MENLELIEQFSLVLAVVALFLVGLLSVRLNARLQRQQEAFASLRNDVRALCGAAVTVGERLNGLDRRVRQLAQRQDELGMRQEQLDQSEPEGRSFDQAIKLAHKGTNINELMELCGLTRGEAELVTMLHRLDPDA